MTRKADRFYLVWGFFMAFGVLLLAGAVAFSQSIDTKRNRLTKFSQLHSGSFAGLVLSATDSTVEELYADMVPAVQAINGDLDARKIEEIMSNPAAVSPGRAWLLTKFTVPEIDAFIAANKIP